MIPDPELERALRDLRNLLIDRLLRDGLRAFLLRYFGLVFVVAGVVSLFTIDRAIEVWAGVGVVVLGALLLLLARVESA